MNSFIQDYYIFIVHELTIQSTAHSHTGPRPLYALKMQKDADEHHVQVSFSHYVWVNLVAEKCKQCMNFSRLVLAAVGQYDL